MACTDTLEALRALLGCVQADGAQVSDAILEEKNETKLKKLTISELKPGMLLLATDEGRKRDGQKLDHDGSFPSVRGHVKKGMHEWSGRGAPLPSRTSSASMTWFRFNG